MNTLCRATIGIMLVIALWPCVASASPRNLDQVVPSTLYSDPQYFVDYSPSELIATDLNHDGNQDLLSLGFRFGQNGSVTILMGDGNAAFAPPILIPICERAADFAHGDFDGDGQTDLVVGCAESKKIMIYRGDPDDLFVFDHESDYEGVLWDLCVSDVDQDSIDDILIVSNDPNAVVVLPGIGDGTFGEMVAHPLGDDAGPSSITIEDLNQDLVPDLIVTDRIGDRVFVLLGAGQGQFGTPVAYPVGECPMNASAGDLNGDLVPDFVVANDRSGGLSFFYGIGDGTFESPIDPDSLVSSASDVQLIDMDLDGLVDVFVSPYRLYRQLPDGTFDLVRNGGLYNDPVTYLIADLNGDPFPDLVIANYRSSTLSVLPGSEERVFYERDFQEVDQGPEVFAVVDLDHDGLDDLVAQHVFTDEFGNIESYEIYTHRTKPDGTIQQRHEFQLESHLRSLQAADLNEDGVYDLVLKYGNDPLKIYFGQESGGFTGATDLEEFNHYPEFAIADLNSDGHLDIAAFRFSPSDQRGLQYHEGVGDGTFQSAVEIVPFVAGATLLAEDLNGDGVLDLLLCINASCSAYYGLGGGVFFTGIHSTLITSDTSNFQVADFDRDGLIDLMYFDNSNGRFVVQRGADDGAFETEDYLQGYAPLALSQVELGDFNCDGNIDIKYRGRFSTYGILFGDGAAGFGQDQVFDSIRGVSSVLFGDFNGDPAPDLVMSSTSQDGIRLEFHRQPGLFVSPADLNEDFSVDAADLGIMIREIGPCPRGGSCLADLNADGVVDMADLGLLLADFGA